MAAAWVLRAASLQARSAPQSCNGQKQAARGLRGGDLHCPGPSQDEGPGPEKDPAGEERNRPQPSPKLRGDRLSVESPEDREGTGQIKGPGKKGASVLEAVGKTGQKRAGAHRYPRAQTGFPSAEMQSALGILGPRVHAGARASVGSSGQQDAGVWMQKTGGLWAGLGSCS